MPIKPKVAVLTTDQPQRVISSDAPELSSARIQLELEAFQLGSARGILGSARIVSNLAKRAICTTCRNFFHINCKVLFKLQNYIQIMALYEMYA